MNSHTIATTNCKAPGSAGTVARTASQPHRSVTPLAKGEERWTGAQKKDSLWWDTFFFATQHTGNVFRPYWCSMMAVGTHGKKVLHVCFFLFGDCKFFSLCCCDCPG